MIVDDSVMVRDLLTQAVLQGDHEGLGVEPKSIQAVLASARAFRPNLVITDFSMPDCPGEDLIRAIRLDPSLGSTPVLVFTAHRDPEVLHGLTNLGIHGLVFKGISLQELMAKVDAIL